MSEAARGSVAVWPSFLLCSGILASILILYDNEYKLSKDSTNEGIKRNMARKPGQVYLKKTPDFTLPATYIDINGEEYYSLTDAQTFTGYSSAGAYYFLHREGIQTYELGISGKITYVKKTDLIALMTPQPIPKEKPGEA
jgi:hypothetical protein